MTVTVPSNKTSRNASISTTGVRLGAVALALAGPLFVLYPLIRPFSDEASATSLQAATAFASNAWVLAHMLGVVGFILVVLGLLGLANALQATTAKRLSVVALVVTVLAVGGVLPYFGAEIFGLHAIGQEALKQHSTAVLSLVGDIRYGPAIYVFGTGLVLLIVGPVLAAIAVWRSGLLPRWSGSLFALGFALYLPQFFGNQPIRVAHGVLVMIGCLWLAWSMWNLTRLAPQESSQPEQI